MSYFSVDISKWTEDTRRLVGGKRVPVEGGLEAAKRVDGFVQVSGIPKILQNWTKVDRYIRGWATRRARMAASEIVIQSLIEVPRASGDLAGSIFMDEVASDYGPGIRINVGYDTDEIEYAWIQHENPEYNHPTPGTKYHYLVDPFDDVSKRYPEEVAEDVQRAIQKVNFKASPETGGISDSDYEEGMGIDDAWAARRAAREKK